MSTLRDRLVALKNSAVDWLRFVWPRRSKQPVMVETKVKRKTRTPSDPTHDDGARETGSYYKFGELLDDLNHYFEHIKVLRKVSPDDYHLFSRIGVPLVGRDAACIALEARSLEPVWRNRATRPAIGGMFYAQGHGDLPEKWEDQWQTFYFFHRMNAPMGVQSSGDDIYKITVGWTDPKRPRKAMVCSYCIALDDAANITVLKQLCEDRKTIRSKSVQSRRVFGRGFSVPLIRWRYPPDLVAMTKVWNEIHPDDPRTADLFAEYIFCFAASANHAGAADGFQVMTTNGEGLVARFSIDMLRTPYFFADRDKTTTSSGATRKIFHIVRTHGRNLATGRKIYVKSHFRGERHFHWKGYDVSVSLPGYHHRSMLEFDSAMEDRPRKPGERTMGARAVGNLLMRHMVNGGWHR